MRPFLVSVVLLAACANHGIPADVRPQATFLPASPVAELPRKFELVAFNVHMEPGAKVAAAIAGDRAIRDADVIVMEEVHRAGLGCNAACEVGRRLGYHVVYAPGHAAGDGDDGVAVLSRAPIRSAQILTLPYFNVHVNSGRRVALAVTVEQDGRPITVYAVHLDNRLTVDDRRTQMEPVLEHARQQSTPVIIAGDFNTSPFTWISHLVPVLTTTQDNRLEQLVRRYGFATPVTDSGPTSRFLGMKLDAIYTRGFDTVKFATAHAADVSDHLALWAILTTPAPTTRRIAYTEVGVSP